MADGASMLLQAAGAALPAGLALVSALAVDRWWGEPPVAVHPVVWMGRALQWCGERIAPERPVPADARAFLLGAVAWLALASLTAGVAWMLQRLAGQVPWWLAAPLVAVLLKPMLAWRMLHEIGRAHV